jgi:hypothetical protein
LFPEFQVNLGSKGNFIESEQSEDITDSNSRAKVGNFASIRNLKNDWTSRFNEETVLFVFFCENLMWNLV